MNYWSLLKAHPRTIGFGFLNCFFSGFGQTAFISIYSPIIMGAFALSSAEYGSIYSVLTLVSGFVITFIGPLIDRVDARYFALFIGAGLLVSQSLIVSMGSLAVVALGLFGLRLFGQGLSTSLASITIARFFDQQRGKALSLTQLGFPLYEGLMTPLATALIAAWSFQWVGLGLIALILVIYIPLGFLLTRKHADFNKVANLEMVTEVNAAPQPKSWNRRQVFSNKTVYFIIPQVLMPPFALTGIFFHQAVVADLKGWTLSLMASGLFFFALGRIINTFFTGPLVDKYSASKLFPFYQFPMALGFLVMASSSQLYIPALSFALCGLSVGAGGPIKSAIWAELYGVKHLGAIKSLFATLMILSTAASPALFGWVIDQSASPAPLLVSLSGISVLAAGFSFFGLKSH